ncbi:hypothetical protein NIES2107_72170 (plasmid) [Nostoc carneum NIES-2107]|nr:hypothetical protein NIES2107_72170 [Nostoc carneum NIES-2107]
MPQQYGAQVRDRLMFIKQVLELTDIQLTRKVSNSTITAYLSANYWLSACSSVFQVLSQGKLYNFATIIKPLPSLDIYQNLIVR